MGLDFHRNNVYGVPISNGDSAMRTAPLDKPLAFRPSKEARQRLEQDELVTGVPVAEILRRMTDARYGLLPDGAEIPKPTGPEAA
jgi:hypothetical protein